MNFITAEDLCKFANKVPDESDTLPASYCQSAMEMVRDYLGYDPELQTYTQTVKGDGGFFAALEAMPINSITAFSVDGTESDPTALEVETENYVCYKDGSFFHKGSR